MTAFAELSLEARTEELERAVREIRKIGDAGDQTERRVKRSTDAMGGTMRVLTRAAAAAGAAIGAAMSVRQLARATEAYTQMTNGLRVLGLSGEQAADRLSDIADIAARTRTPLEATAQLYQRVSIAAGELGANQQQVLRFTENVGLALAQQGGSAAQASGALLQLSQSLAGGTVRAEEFNSMLEGAFPLVQAAARGIEGAAGSVGKLRQMVMDGTVSSEAFFQAILSQSDELEAAFANTSATVSQALGQLSDRFTLAIGEMDAALGVSSGIADGILFLANNLDLAAGGVAALGLAIGVSYVPALIGAIGATATWTGALALLQAALIKTGVGALVVGLGVAVALLFRAREATGSWGEAFSLAAAVVGDVLERINQRMKAFDNAVYATTNDAKASFLDMAAGVIEGVEGAIRGVDGFITGVVNASIEGVASMVNVAIDGLNKIIELANKVSPRRISTIGAFEPAQVGSVMGGAADGLGGMASGLRSGAGDARQAAIDQRALADILTELGGQPLESLEALRAKMAETSDETLGLEDTVRQLNDALLNPAGGEGSAGGSGGGGGEDGFTSRLEALQTQFQTEREIIETWRDEAMLLMEDKRAMERLGEQGHKEMMLAIEEEYQRRLRELQGKSEQQQLQDRQTFFQAATSLMQSENKVLFNIGKAAAIAQALLQARESVVASYRFGARIGGPALGAAFAGVAAAATAAQIAKIASTKIGGGSGGAVSSGGGAPSANSGNREPAQAPQQQQRVLRFDVQGDGMFADMLRQNVEAIADAIVDEQRMGGTTILVGRA